MVLVCICGAYSRTIYGGVYSRTILLWSLVCNLFTCYGLLRAGVNAISQLLLFSGDSQTFLVEKERDKRADRALAS